MSTWVGSDGTYIYNLDHFAEIGVESRPDGLFFIRAWSQPAMIGADGTRFPRGDAVTLAELTSAGDLESALAYLRARLCAADFQQWSPEDGLTG